MARLFLLLLLVLASRPAHAAEALLLEPKIDGPALAAEVGALQEAAMKALKAQQFGLIDAREAQGVIAGEASLRDCYSDLCLERLGRLLNAGIVVRFRGKVTLPEASKAADKQPSWKFRVDVLDVELGATGAHPEVECPGCSVKQAAEKLADTVTTAVLETASRPRGVLEVRSEPSGATVYVDGTELGVTPYKRAAFAGSRKVVVRHVGFLSQQLEASVPDGQKAKLDAKLVPGTDPVSVVVVEKERTPVYKKWWFWTALAGGVLVAGAVTTGIVLGTRSTPPERMVPGNVIMF
jgi:hypothetical protein